MKLLVLLLYSLLLSGCLHSPIYKKTPASSNATEIILQAKKLRQKKLYSEAEALLFQARITNPDNLKLQRLLRQVMTERHRYRQQIEDQLLIARVTFIQQQRPLLAKLAKSEADDRMISAQLNHMNSEWSESRQPLSNCGKRRLRSNPETAEKCLRFALAISEQKSDRDRLTQLEEQKIEAKNVALHKEIVAEKNAQQIARENQITQLLEQVHNKQQMGEHRDALHLIKQILELSPNHSTTLLLEEQIKNELTELTNKLLNKGDILYQNGQFKEAVATWKTLLLLNPNHKPAKERLQRVQRVLGNLKELREKQKTTLNQTN
jgi:tetratricopeptide (TPR) repeat protein